MGSPGLRQPLHHPQTRTHDDLSVTLPFCSLPLAPSFSPPSGRPLEKGALHSQPLPLLSPTSGPAVCSLPPSCAAPWSLSLSLCRCFSLFCSFCCLLFSLIHLLSMSLFLCLHLSLPASSLLPPSGLLSSYFSPPPSPLCLRPDLSLPRSFPLSLPCFCLSHPSSLLPSLPHSCQCHFCDSCVVTKVLLGRCGAAPQDWTLGPGPPPEAAGRAGGGAQERTGPGLSEGGREELRLEGTLAQGGSWDRS